METTIKVKCDGCGVVFDRSVYHHLRKQRDGEKASYCYNACYLKNRVVILPSSVIDDYKSGESLTVIGKKHGTTANTVRKHLASVGVEIRRRTAHLSTDRNPTKGKGHTETARAKIRAATEKQFSDPAARHAAAVKQAQAMESGKIRKVSKVEDMVAAELIRLGVAFKRQKMFHSKGVLGSVACVDFYLENGTVIEVNGTYWHADPRFYPDGPVFASQKKTVTQYEKKLAFLAEQGIPVIELWESDLRNDAAGVVETALA